MNIPNGYEIIARCDAGFIGLHKIKGRYILGEIRRDVFENEYVAQYRKSDSMFYLSDNPPPGEARWWEHKLLAKLMAQLIKKRQAEIGAFHREKSRDESSDLAQAAYRARKMVRDLEGSDDSNPMIVVNPEEARVRHDEGEDVYYVAAWVRVAQGDLK